MLRTIAFCSTAALISTLAMSTGAAAQGYTTRIEPRPFYGAVVTLEEGVRVIRPLPPERQVIINPDNRTPLSLGFNDTHVYENRVQRNYNYNAGPDNAQGGAFYGTTGGFGRGFGKHDQKSRRGIGGVDLGPSHPAPRHPHH